jgi:hypothetical protein
METKTENKEVSAAPEKKYRIRANVPPRPMGAAADGTQAHFPGHGGAGIYFPTGKSTWVITEKQLRRLEELDKPVDAKGRPQFQFMTFEVLGEAKADEALGRVADADDAAKAAAKDASKSSPPPAYEGFGKKK